MEFKRLFSFSGIKIPIEITIFIAVLTMSFIRNIKLFENDDWFLYVLYVSFFY